MKVAQFLGYMISDIRLFIGGSIAFFLFASCSGEAPSTQEGNESSSREFPVRAIVLEPKTFTQTFHSTGTFSANEQVLISSEIPGRIQKIHFREGEKVKVGQLLVSINADDILAEKQRLEAALENAKTKKNRAENLVAIEAISQEEVDDLLYEVERIESELAENQVRYNRSRIRAPFNGIMGFRIVSPGAYLNVGDEIVEIVQQNPLKVDFELPQSYADWVSIGDSIQIQLANNETFAATIDVISSRIQMQNRSFQVRSILPNEERNIMPGSFANISIPIYRNEAALLAPTEVVIKTLGKEEVFLVRNGKAVKVEVSSGVRKEKFLELKSGVQAGDTLIITGLLSLSNGNAVDPTLVELSNPKE
jgi:membrane fusion protein (multidrug efflux system)